MPLVSDFVNFGTVIGSYQHTGGMFLFTGWKMASDNHHTFLIPGPYWTSLPCASCCSLQCVGWRYVQVCGRSGKMCSLGTHFLENKEKILLWTRQHISHFFCSYPILRPKSSSLFPQLLPTHHLPPCKLDVDSALHSSFQIDISQSLISRVGDWVHSITQTDCKKPWTVVKGQRVRQNKNK